MHAKDHGERDSSKNNICSLEWIAWEGDLVAFKHFLEARGEETGAWRGSVASPDERPSA
jgi:hypothetical protein